MINKILIKNYAIIEHANIVLNPGFTVITGETGAGKSLLLEATGVVLGMRADRMMVRDGMEKAVIEATFKDASLRRVVYSKGGSKSFKNDVGISLTDLKRENKARVDFHGQHDQQFILDKSTHIEYLDRYCGHQSMVRELEKLFLEISNSKLMLEQIKKNERIKTERMDLLKFQLDEIDNVNPKLEEDHDIKKRYIRMNNFKDIIQTYQSASNEISESDQSLINKLNLIYQKFASTEKFDPEISKIKNSINGILLELEEVNSNISAQLHDATFDQEEFGILEDRMSLLESIKRKHGGSIESVLEKRGKIENEIKELSNSDQLAESLADQIIKMEKKFSEIAIKIHKKRKNESKKLSKRILDSLSALNMKGSSFEIIIEQEKDKDGFVSLNKENILANSKGIDKVEFYLSANPGEPVKPLVSVASGGEISRIMLAIKSVFQHLDPVKTLVFDEIDAGISGKAAEKVADYLLKLSKSKQVICITHLSQIIRRADYHLHLEKFVKKNKTNVKIKYLNKSESIDIMDYMFSGKTNIGA